MDKTRVTIRTYFQKLGLESEIADIYLALYSHGPQTISALARNSRVERTRIYRLIGQLNASNLVEVEAGGRRGIIKAAPITNLRILINEREAELKNLQDELELIEQALSRNSLSNPAFRVQLYSGSEGVRQLLWNLLQADTELLGQGLSFLQNNLDKNVLATWAHEVATRTQGWRLLGEPADAAMNLLPSAQIRYVDGGPSPAFQFTVAYNETVACVQRSGGEVYGLELYNSGIAASQRQQFEALWVGAHERVPD